MTSRRQVGGALLLAIALAGCASSATRTATPIPAAPTPTPVPGAGGNTGGGVVPPGGAGGVDPILGQATLVVPQPGQHDVRAVNVQLVRSAIDGHHVTLELRWWSGVAPCSVLDSVDVSRDGSTYAITVNEGSSGQQVACIDIAQLKATVVDLGDLDPGTYTIRAIGEAKPIEVTVT